MQYTAAVVLALLALGLGEGASSGSEPVTLFVSPDGNDDHDGTEAKPFASLARACAAARQLGRQQRRRIVLRGGHYYEASIRLGPEDSHLSIEAASGETPVLIGGRRVTGWEKDGPDFWAAPLPGVKEKKWDFRSLVVNGELRPRARLP